MFELLFVVGCLTFVGSLLTWGILAQLDTHRRLGLQANRQGVRRAILRELRGDVAAATALRVGVPGAAVSAAVTASDSRAIVQAARALLELDSPRKMDPEVGFDPRLGAVANVLLVANEWVDAGMPMPRVKAPVWPRVEVGGTLRVTTAAGVVQYSIETLVDEEAERARTGPVNTTLPPEPLPQRVRRVDAAGEVRTWDLQGQTFELSSVPGAEERAVRVRFEDLLKFKTGHRRVRRFETTLAAGWGGLR